ncbi:ATP-binding cassette domain-containing protein [Desulfoferrobacter suflitae]|uniref:ATP-binding cassette domain-containing protein n=1 Tax=Desulfoferrobacter suflitae TaxID=2865782 RepID=UPI00338FE994
MSGGQQQRVAIARALITDPKLVIADEPTANLDTANAVRIIELIREINTSRGTTFVFSTHDQRLLQRVQRQIHLADGLIMADRQT